MGKRREGLWTPPKGATKKRRSTSTSITCEKTRNFYGNRRGLRKLENMDLHFSDKKKNKNAVKAIWLRGTRTTRDTKPAQRVRISGPLENTWS